MAGYIGSKAVLLSTTAAVVTGDADIGGDLTVDTNTLFVDATNNRVGIGTSSPSQGIHLKTASGNSYVKAERTTSSQGEVGFNTDNWYMYQKTGGTDLHFYNTADRMTIDSSGNVGIGTSSPVTKLTIGDNGTGLGFANAASGNFNLGLLAGVGSADAYVYQRANAPMIFGTNNTERMRIDSSGNLLVGTTIINPHIVNSGTAVVLSNDGAVKTTNTGPSGLFNRHSSDGEVLRFLREGVDVGSIDVTVSATSYNTSSDYRLKENVVPLSGAADRLAQIPVHRFNFIADPDTTVDGFLAHEVQEFVPECVTGTKDQVETVEVTDEDGNVTTETRPVYQGIDQSKLVPLLTAALQEALQKIDALEARIVILEGGAA